MTQWSPSLSLSVYDSHQFIRLTKILKGVLEF